jgi:hypothetical protein
VNVKSVVIAASLAIVAALAAGIVCASEADQSIKVTFSQPVEIPGKVLPAGTYWFVLANTPDRETVQILNGDRSESYAILQTVNRERPESQYGAAFVIAEREKSQPAAVIAWFYPGSTVGHEFLYPAQVEKQLALAKQDIEVSGD